MIGVLGPLEISGRRVGGSRLRVLLIRLALEPGRVVTSERLIDDLWPEEPPEHPAAALQSLVSRARREVPGVISSHPAGYVLDAEVDAALFERLARAGEHRAALALWRGTALADARSMPFAQAPAARLEELRLRSLAARIEDDLGEHDVLPELEELTTAHPLREPFHALLVRALAGADRRGEALEAFERIRSRLAGELGADPGPELRQAHLDALRERRRGNLPAPLTGFVGRQADVERVRGLVRSNRLVTLTGPGGVGKTRLALEVAAALDVPDGAWLVELAGAADVRAAVEAVVPLKDSAPLLVLDNCEHVVDEAAAVAQRLLSAHPRLRILATSREALDVTGESVHVVPPLPEREAARLFAERALAVRADAQVESVPVGRLDGLPLAIELAAARLRTMPASTVSEQLADVLGLRGSRTAQPRHRTLRAVIEWSWRLLEPAEQRLLSRMSVFSGGATSGAVLEVCGAEGEVLASLVDKSLVQLRGERYALLETVRRFAAEHLDDDGLAARHARYFVELAERAEPELRSGARQLGALALFEAESGNLDAAMAWSPDRAFLARVWFWMMRGRRREAQTWAAALLDRTTGAARGLCELIATGELPPGLTESGHPAARAGWALSVRLAPPRDVIELAEGEVSRRPGDPVAALMAGIAQFEYGDAARAERLLPEALDGFRATGDRWGLALALYWLSLAAENRGDPAGALELALRSVEPATEIGGVQALPGPAHLGVRVARLQAELGEFAAADAALDALDVDDPLALARIAHARAEVARRRGTPDRERAEEALRLLMGQEAPDQFAAQVQVELAYATASPQPLRRALELMDGHPDRTARAIVLEHAAAWCGSQRLLDAARALRSGQATMPSPERYALSLLSSSPSKPM
ncbi:AfsR/SARP family transcriptional regulator [Nonomuraea soli]|uniref:Putative ATPase/DNA-binding SARP family transcriptional activator n=1 Tax=Nonomuraea soli TaxID=1032476 RepID=A0A7W0CEU2_9ACTN|nr:AfsR/SARP family transcriptional regulator [Nonomuraea soli]MBA2889848.1 putative ATPase/DNA-binding SARP family transcriptional activator [Nonomuraea soli]